MIGTGIGILKRPQIAPQNARDYRTRVAAGSGSIINDGDMVRLYKFYLAQGTLANTRVLFDANAGMVQRLDGVLRYVRTAFDLSSNANNLDGSATATQQPRLVGGIAPGSKAAASNQNGEARYFTFSEVDRSATGIWSITAVMRWRGSAATNETITGKAVGNTALRIKGATNVINFVNSSGTSVSGTVSTAPLIGKNKVIHFIANGTTLKVYVSGVLFDTITVSTVAKFDSLLKSIFSSLSFFHLNAGELTTSQITDEAAMLATRYPEMESVVIGSQTWATRNFEAVVTPMGNVIPEMQAATAGGNLFINGTFDTDTSWTKASSWTISGGKAVFDNSANGSLSQTKTLGLNKYYKLKFTISDTTGASIGFSNITGATFYLGYSTYAAGTYELCFLASAINGFAVQASSVLGASFKLDDVELYELGWSDSTFIYNAIYARTAGTADQKRYAALKEAAMWCYHSNTTDNGATYGKLYNGYAKALLKLDLATAAFGWHVETEAELNTLAALGGNALKYAGTNYWTTAGGTNTTSFTALGGANRSGTDGTFSTIKNTAVFGDDTGTKALTISHDSDTATVATVDIRDGNSIRLIKD